MNISLRFTDFFIRIRILSKDFSSFFLFFLSEMRKFLIISFFSSKVLGFESKRFLFEVFAGYFTPWIRIRGSANFCGSRFLKPK